MTLFITNQTITPTVERKTFDGREHLVVPVVAIVEGVLNGELVTANEISKFVHAWNGIPLPLGHPIHQGTPISANSPDLIDTQAIGRFFNANFTNGKLCGEMWIDTAKAKAIGGDALLVLERIEAGQPLEVSTAYFREIEESTGTFNGKQYGGIARNLRPDHLALLPHAVGACSWDMGCGAPRINHANNCTCKKEPAMNDTTWGQIAESLKDLNAFMRETLVTKKADTPATNEKEPEMKKELIDGLIANAETHWKEEDRKTLEAMEEAVLKKMAPLKANEKPDPAPDPKPEPVPDPKPADPQPAAVAANVTYPPAVQRLIDEDEAARKALVAKLSANQACRLTQDELQKQDRDFLERLDATLTPADYSGRGLPRPQVNTQNFEFDPAPGDANFKFEQAH